MSKLARSAEAVSFLPEVADDLVPQRRRAVSEGTAVSFSTGRIVEEVAVISMVAHVCCSVVGARKRDSEVTAFTPSSVQEQQDAWMADKLPLSRPHCGWGCLRLVCPEGTLYP